MAVEGFLFIVFDQEYRPNILQLRRGRSRDYKHLMTARYKLPR